MIICTQKKALLEILRRQKQPGVSIGFVPTMGALHQGHLSLIRQSKQENDLAICSIFVNPTQFNDPKDFDKYPKTTEQDILLLKEVDCDILFLPSVTEMYNPDEIPKKYNLGYLETILEGKYRPGHFQGVCIIVDKLLQIVGPHRLYLGQKDYQQCMVIQKMILDHFPNDHMKLVICSTERESTGLAMSSRNVRLSEEAKEKAVTIFNCLQTLQKQLQHLPFEELKSSTMHTLLSSGFSTVDYVSIANAATLKEESDYHAEKKYIALIAAFIEEVRLIDNLLLN